MNRMTRFLVAGTVAAAASISASGCVDNNETLFINGVLALTPPSCVYDPDPTQPILIQGTLDVLFKHSYSAGILVGNQYTPRGVKQNLKAESTRITLRGAEVTLTDSLGAQVQCQGNPNCGSFTVYGTGFVDTNRAEEPAWGFFGAELIPQSVGKFIHDGMTAANLVTKTVYASVRVFGESLGGQEVTSSELTFPIKLCTGCLIDFPLVALEGGHCVVSASNLPTEKPCTKGQDELVDCRYCSDGTANPANPCNLPPPTFTQ
jgi:hypothetical protein